MYEEELSKSLFKEVNPLPGDCEAMSGLPIRNIWQGDYNMECSIILRIRQTLQIGRTITFDMGQVAKVSRFKMYQRRGNDPVNVWAYDHNNLKNMLSML